MSVILLKNRSKGEDPYELEFAKVGYRSVFVPVLEHLNVNGSELRRKLHETHRYGALIITSQKAVEACGAQLESMKELDVLDKVVYTVGPATAEAVRNLGFLDVRGEGCGNGDILANTIIAETGLQSSLPLLFLVGNKRRDIIHRKLAEHRVPLEELVVYETRTKTDFHDRFEEACSVDPDWIVFFSPGGADVILRALTRTTNPPRIATIGPTTEEYLLQSWEVMPTVVSPKPEPVSLVQAIISAQRQE